MLLSFCDLALRIIWNLLVFLNKTKMVESSKGKSNSSLNDSDLEKILNEIRVIDSEKKARFNADRSRMDEIALELRTLNSRLKNIEFLLYEKKAKLLREKVIGHYNKEEDG
ncbi:MAG: hypothetical protein ACRCX2_36335 [Paraclostridium sp.]